MPEGVIQDEDTSELFRSIPSLRRSPSPSLSPTDILSLPKNRSTGNLLAGVPKPTEGTRIRFSFDAGTSREYDAMARSPIVPEHEHGLGVSGLRRIRQQPPPRIPTFPSSPESSFSFPSRSSSMTLNLPSSRTFTSGGPSSPTFNFSEDLTRFPSESLHSFSFAHQSEDVLHNRQNVLKRSIEFMRDRLNWAVNHPGIANAQAKISGDTEIQSMMELLTRANLLGNDLDNAQSFQRLHGPLTGPAETDGGNVFEKTFLPRSESPDHIGDPSSQGRASDENSVENVPSLGSTQSRPSTRSTRSERSPHSRAEKGLTPDVIPASTTRKGLKRTYTDTSSISMQTKLMEVLAKPYVAGEGVTGHPLLSPSIMPSFGKALENGANIPSVVHGHGHANRLTPAAQAIFTTGNAEPWTLTSANDLACLVFGITKAEVRKLGILEVVREDRREWLKEKLRSPGSEAAVKARSPTNKSRRSSANPSASVAMGGGITAILLRKPPARQVAATRRAQTDDGSGSSLSSKNARGGPNHPGNKSRGVLLCGDVVPILKRNGATGSASLWVKEKKGGLIWVLEEIVEDAAYLDLDNAGHVLSVRGAGNHIWGDSEKIEGRGLLQLVPRIPMVGSKVDYKTIEKTKTFTARNPDGYNVPTTITAIPGGRELRVSSFPHIAGILVLSSSTLEVTSYNSVFLTALFGHANPDSLHITQLIPQFDKILNLLTSEDHVKLVDGMVIPEHSFRRARALLAVRESNTDAAAIFLRPTGLVAKHCDGEDVYVDVQMRVVQSETVVSDESVIQETTEDEGDEEDDENGALSSTSEVVYALWITYSRHLHSIIRPGGPASPLISRPGTPPRQPSPGQTDYITPQIIDTEDIKPPISPMSLVSQQIQEATSQPIADKSISGSSVPPAKVKSAVAPPIIKEPPRKKTISDFVILEDMGHGAYGQVKSARFKEDATKKVVLKYVTKKRILVDTWTRDRRLGTVPLEIHVLDYLRRDGLKHHNIVEMIDFFEDDVNYYIEMVPHGLPGMDLFDYIEMRPTMEEDECRSIFLQVVDALHHLHTKALVVHRDIKDENIIMDGEKKVKLIDFGSAAYIKNGPFDVFVGTIDYAAPEVLQGKSYRGKEQDVWALGILLYTLVYKENPFYNIDEILDHELRVPWIMSEGSIELIRQMLDRDVERRLTISQVKEHPWCVTAVIEDRG